MSYCKINKLKTVEVGVNGGKYGFSPFYHSQDRYIRSNFFINNPPLQFLNISFGTKSQI